MCNGIRVSLIAPNSWRYLFVLNTGIPIDLWQQWNYTFDLVHWSVAISVWLNESNQQELSLKCMRFHCLFLIRSIEKMLCNFQLCFPQKRKKPNQQTHKQTKKPNPNPCLIPGEVVVVSHIKNAKAVNISIFSLSQCCCYILSVTAGVQHSDRFLSFCCFTLHVF